MTGRRSDRKPTSAVVGIRTGGHRKGERVGFTATISSTVGEVLVAVRGSRVRRHAGIATGIYHPGELDKLRDEWNR